MIASLRFATDLPLWMVGLLMVVGGTTVFWLYYRLTVETPRLYRVLLPTLRTITLLLVLMIIAQPVWHRREVVGTLGRVIFAIDTSQSMSINDSAGDAGRPPRWQRAVGLLRGDPSTAGGGMLSQLAKTHQTDVIRFSDSGPIPVWSSTDVNGDELDRVTDLRLDQPVGGGTNLDSALAPWLAIRSGASEGSSSSQNRRTIKGSSVRLDSRQRAAVVLLSDGQDRKAAIARDTAGQLESAGIRVFSVGLGSPEEPDDVGIESVQAPENVAIDGKIAGRVGLKGFGAVNQPFELRIESQGQQVWQQTIRLESDGVQSVPFQIDVKPIVDRIASSIGSGLNRDSVVIELEAFVESPLMVDSISQNNRYSFRVSASSRDRRLLILDGSSRWEMRYVRNLFDRDPAWQVDTLLFGPGTDQTVLQRGDAPGQLPATREALAQYDAIVLGEIPPAQWESSDSFRLQEYVSRGGGLIVLDGRLNRVARLATDAALAQLIPVQFDPREPLTLESNDAEAAAALPSPHEGLRAIGPTEAAIDLPLFNLAAQRSQSTELWQLLPAPMQSQAVRPAGGAEVWATVTDGAGRVHPWLATRMYGAGRVVYFASDETWRWRYKVADRFHARFWNQVFAAVLPTAYSASDQYASIGTDKIQYQPGQVPEIRVRLQDAEGKPIGDSTVDALLSRDGEVVSVVPLAIDNPDRGTYVGQSPALPPGKYNVRVRASGFGDSSLSATTPIWINNVDNGEMTTVALNEQVLTAIASAGGGAYLHESDGEALLENLRPLSSGTILQSDLALWQSYPWFIAIIALLSIEWLLRKRAGLI